MEQDRTPEDIIDGLIWDKEWNLLDAIHLVLAWKPWDPWPIRDKDKGPGSRFQRAFGPAYESAKLVKRGE